VLHRDPHQGLRLERDPARQHLVEQYPEGVDVGASVYVATHRLLRRDVVGGAEDPPRLREAVGLQRQRDPEIGHLRAPIGVDQDVLRLHVPVNEHPGVRGRQPAADLDRVGRRLVHRQAPEPVDPVLERLALEILEDDVGVALVLAGVDHRDHVRVRELGHRPRLAAEPLDLVRLIGDLRVHDLHGHGSLEGLVASEVHGRHAAGAQLGVQAVAPRQNAANRAPGQS
jgi:hypothetical protein